MENGSRDTDARLNAKRVLPYLTALLLIAWILGSLARSGTGGGSLLSNSYWLVYLVELLPLVALGVIIVFVASLVVNWKILSDALGFGLSRRRRVLRKKSRTVQTILFIAVWAMAGVILMVRCGGIVCKANSQETVTAVKQQVVGTGPFPQIPLLGPVLSLASLVDTNIFVWAFFAVTAICSVIMVRALKVSWDETRAERMMAVELVQAEGRLAVKDAIKVLDGDGGDPRMRIMACYQRMIRAAADLGAPVGADRTARELEHGIRGMFQLKGSGISRLTGLFEVARYSLHSVGEEDEQLARTCLVEISGELGVAPLLEN